MRLTQKRYTRASVDHLPWANPKRRARRSDPFGSIRTPEQTRCLPVGLYTDNTWSPRSAQLGALPRVASYLCGASGELVVGEQPRHCQGGLYNGTATAEARGRRALEIRQDAAAPAAGASRAKTGPISTASSWKLGLVMLVHTHMGGLCRSTTKGFRDGPRLPRREKTVGAGRGEKHDVPLVVSQGYAPRDPIRLLCAATGGSRASAPAIEALPGKRLGIRSQCRRTVQTTSADESRMTHASRRINLPDGEARPSQTWKVSAFRWRSWYQTWNSRNIRGKPPGLSSG